MGLRRTSEIGYAYLTIKDRLVKRLAESKIDANFLTREGTAELILWTVAQPWFKDLDAGLLEPAVKPKPLKAVSGEL